MSDAPMHPNQPSPDDEFFADPAYSGGIDGHGGQGVSPLGSFDGQAHDPFGATSDDGGDGSWLLQEDPAPAFATNVEHVHALPNEFGGAAEPSHWDGAEYADSGEYVEGAEHAGSDGYGCGDDGLGAAPINEDDLVGASYVEPEPTGRAVSRALVPGAIVFVLSFGAVGGWAVYRDGGSLSDINSETAKIATRQSDPAAGEDPVADLAPIDGSAGAPSGRQGYQRDGSIKTVGVAPRSTNPTVDAPREPGELDAQEPERPSFEGFRETLPTTRPSAAGQLAGATPRRAPANEATAQQTGRTASAPRTEGPAREAGTEGPEGYDFAVETYVARGEFGDLGYVAPGAPSNGSPSDGLSFDESLLPEIDPVTLSFLPSRTESRGKSLDAPEAGSPLASAFAAVGHQPVRPRFPFEFIRSGAFDDEPVVAAQEVPAESVAPRSPVRTDAVDETLASLPFGLFQDERVAVEVDRAATRPQPKAEAQPEIGPLVAGPDAVVAGLATERATEPDAIDVDAAHAKLDEIFGMGPEVAAVEPSTEAPAIADAEVEVAERAGEESGAPSALTEESTLVAETTVAETDAIYGPPAPVVPELSEIYPLPLELAEATEPMEVPAAVASVEPAQGDGSAPVAVEPEVAVAPESEPIAEPVAEPSVEVALAPPAPVEPAVAVAPIVAVTPEVLPSIVDEQTSNIRSPVLRRIDDGSIWAHRTVPKSKVGGDRIVLTPKVGNVRVVFDGGESIDGRLHGVGQDKIVLDTSLGRVTLDARRTDRIDRLGGNDLRTPGSGVDSTAGLDRVRVRTAGGTFDGHLLGRDGDQITLLVGEGVRITLTSTDVVPARGSKSASRIRSHGIGE